MQVGAVEQLALSKLRNSLYQHVQFQALLGLVKFICMHGQNHVHSEQSSLLMQGEGCRKIEKVVDLFPLLPLLLYVK